MRPIPDRLTPLECWPVHMTRQDKTDGLCPSQFECNNDVPLFAVDARHYVIRDVIVI